jgi:hypothetical protein
MAGIEMNIKKLAFMWIAWLLTLFFGVVLLSTAITTHNTLLRTLAAGTIYASGLFTGAFIITLKINLTRHKEVERHDLHQEGTENRELPGDSVTNRDGEIFES